MIIVPLALVSPLSPVPAPERAITTLQDKAGVQNKQRVSGTWRVMYEDPATGVIRKKLIMIRRSSDGLRVYGSPQGEVLFAKRRLNEVSLPLILLFNSGSSLAQSNLTLRSSGLLTGMGSVNGKAIQIDAYPVDAFQCGNHVPPHVAESEGEIKKLSKDLGCKNWSLWDLQKSGPPTLRQTAPQTADTVRKAKMGAEMRADKAARKQSKKRSQR